MSHSKENPARFSQSFRKGRIFIAKPNDFDIPRIFYFESGNIFTGSRDNLNFRIVPDKEQMTVSVWHGFICSELTEMEASETFPLSVEGHTAMLAWLDTQYHT